MTILDWFIAHPLATYLLGCYVLTLLAMGTGKVRR